MVHKRYIGKSAKNLQVLSFLMICGGFSVEVSSVNTPALGYAKDRVFRRVT